MTEIQTTATGHAVVERNRKPRLSETPDRPDLGDDAWLRWSNAIQAALTRTQVRGCKQQVRRIYGSLWLVQDVR